MATMDSSVKESFVIDISQRESFSTAEHDIKLYAKKALEAASEFQRALDNEKTIDAKNKAPGETDTASCISQATTADSQVSTQVKPHNLDKYIQSCVARALEALEEANNLIATKGLQQTEKTTQLEKTKRQEKTTRLEKKQANPAIEATDAETESSGEEDASELPTKSQSQKRMTAKRITALCDAVPDVNPDARLLIAYPKNSSHLLSGCSVIPLQQTLDGDELFAIIQTEDDVDFLLLLPTYQQSSIAEPDEVQIAYNMYSDICHLRLRTKVTNNIIRVTSLLTRFERHLLLNQEEIIMDTGVWRVSVSDPSNDFNATIDILVLPRPFEVVIHRPEEGATCGLGKRQAIDDRGYGGSTKRRRVPSGNLFSSGNIIHRPTPTLLELHIGSIAEISSQRQSEAYASYTLKKERRIYENNASGVYECSHSNLNKVVAKFFRQKPGTLFHVAEAWKREREMLKPLNHGNIVKLLAADARVFTLYLELLPASLCHLSQTEPPPFPVSNTLEILRDISSALDYLKTQNVVHYDVKPKNIAYSKIRGAVLLDFGLSSAPGSNIWGTWGYLPPELFNGRLRDFAGDIWALGITTLFIHGNISLPEKSRFMLRCTPDFTILQLRHRMWWDDCLFPALKQLKKQTAETVQEAELCSLVVKMLCEDIEARIGAAELSVAAQELLNSLTA